MGRVLCRPTLLWAEFAMGRVCYGPRCPVAVWTGKLVLSFTHNTRADKLVLTSCLFPEKSQKKKAQRERKRHISIL